MIHAMRSKMLSRSDYDRIFRADKLSDTLAALRETGYGQLIREQESSDGHVGLEVALAGSLFGDISALFAMAPYEAKHLLQAMSLRARMQLVKVIIRAAFTGSTLEEYPIPEGLGQSREALSDLARSGNVARVADLIPDESIRRELMNVPSGRDSSSLFLVETAIDASVYNRLWQASLFLGGLDRQIAKRIITAYVDMTNTMTLLRARLLHLGDELEQQLTIPASSANITALNKARSARTLQEAIRILATGPYAALIEKATSGRNEEESLSGIEMEFRRELAKLCRAAFQGSPFNAGLIVAFLFLRELEISDVGAIVTARKNEIPNERLKELLVSSS